MDTVFDIPAISCGHCLRSIERELGFVDGVEYVEGDVETRKVRVSYVDESALDSARTALAEIGFAPSD